MITPLCRRSPPGPWFILCFGLALSAALAAEAGHATGGNPSPMLHLQGDYDAELRRPDGRVDGERMTARLRDLGANTYFWLIWHGGGDWEDLKLFLPRAARDHLQVWVYLVPPSESPPHATQYSEPFRLDYLRWAEEIARLSVEHPNLTGWVMDDFYANHQLFTPLYVRQMQAKAKAINPRLVFLPLLYFSEITRRFALDYGATIDGVVVAYPQDRAEIDQAWAILNDVVVAPAGELSFPWATASRAGDFILASQTAKVLPAERYAIQFREADDFNGQTAGYHFKQFLVEGVVVWEKDVAGGPNALNEVQMDVTERVRGKAKVTLGFRLLDKQGVSNFGVRWRLQDWRATGVQLVADLRHPEQWRVQQQGAFVAGFGPALGQGQRAFHIPFIVMTAGQAAEFRQRHGDPASPARMADWLRMCFQARRDGKCDGVVTYCLEKESNSPTFDLARELFRRYRNAWR